MQRILTFIYLIATSLVAVITTYQQIQPARFFIAFFAPNPGDIFSQSLVTLLVWLSFLFPLTVLLLILKAFRKKPVEVITPDRTGVFVTRKKAFQSAVIGFPIFINSKKVGIIDNGRTVFFDVPVGSFIIQAGKGKHASEILEAKVEEKDQLNFAFELREDGLFTKIRISQIVPKS